MTDGALHEHLIGREGSRQELNTPVLVLDLDALTRNINRMAHFAAAHGVHLRPHVKTHKSVDIARLQQAAGAIGFCCAKLGEAEVLAENGLTHGLHITSPVVSGNGLERLAALNQRTTGLMCVVDHPSIVATMGQAASKSGKAIEVLIDIDPGIHRTGVASPDAALELLSAIRSQPMLIYKGVQCYCGMQQHIASFAERRASNQECAAASRRIIDALAAAGAAPEIVTGGGTGTHRLDVDLGIFTELQTGSYVFMDTQYLDCDLTGNADATYEVSLMVDATVISANAPGLVTIDAGFKALSTDGSLPRVLAGAASGATYAFMGDEHGALIYGAAAAPNLTDRVTLTTPHCDPTVNLYDWYHVVQGNTLRAIWPVSARGRSR